MNFFNIIKKGTNTQLESLKSSAIYEIAAEKLEPKPYAQQAKPLFLLSKYFSVAYHLLSYSIALIGITLYASQLDSFIYKSILILLAFILLAVVEIAKTNSSNTVFAAKARQEQPNNLFLGILVITTIFSFVTSVWSAKEAVYFASTDSKFVSMDSLKNRQIDSVNTLYANQVSSLESIILSNQNTLKTTKTNWKVNTATKAIQENQTNLTDVLEKKQKALLAINSIVETEKGTTAKKGVFIASLAAVIFFIFEVLNLVGYWFLYQYYSTVLLEKDLVLNRLSKSLTSAVHDVTQNLTNAVANVVPTSAVTTAVAPPPFATNSHRNPIGFQTNQNSQTTASVTQITPQTTAVQSGNGNRICQNPNCQKEYIYKVHNQKFCSEKCRIENWKRTTGKTFIKGKKK